MHAPWWWWQQGWAPAACRGAVAGCAGLHGPRKPPHAGAHAKFGGPVARGGCSPIGRTHHSRMDASNAVGGRHRGCLATRASHMSLGQGNAPATAHERPSGLTAQFQQRLKHSGTLCGGKGAGSGCGLGAPTLRPGWCGTLVWVIDEGRGTKRKVACACGRAGWAWGSSRQLRPGSLFRPHSRPSIPVALTFQQQVCKQGFAIPGACATRVHAASPAVNAVRPYAAGCSAELLSMGLCTASGGRGQHQPSRRAAPARRFLGHAPG
jgi:hypothetical protein